MKKGRMWTHKCESDRHGAQDDSLSFSTNADLRTVTVEIQEAGVGFDDCGEECDAYASIVLSADSLRKLAADLPEAADDLDMLAPERKAR